MKCLICDEIILLKKNFGNLFSNKKYFICNKCYNRYQVSLNYQLIINKDKEIHWFYMFEEKYNINLEAFILEFSYLFDYVLKKIDPKSILIICDDYLEYKKKYEIIESFDEQHIFLLTYF